MEGRVVMVRLRGAVSGEDLGAVTVTSFEELHNRCPTGARFLYEAREITTQDELDALGDEVELQVLVDAEAAARAATVEALLECDPLDIASLTRLALAAGKLDGGFWDRKPEVLRVVRTHGALFGWAGRVLRGDADVALATLRAHPPGSECWQRCFPRGAMAILRDGLLRDDALAQEAARLDVDASLLQRRRAARAHALARASGSRVHTPQDRHI
jgi:hypothetical protein